MFSSQACNIEVDHKCTEFWKERDWYAQSCLLSLQWLILIGINPFLLWILPFPSFGTFSNSCYRQSRWMREWFIIWNVPLFWLACSAAPFLSKLVIEATAVRDQLKFSTPKGQYTTGCDCLSKHGLKCQQRTLGNNVACQRWMSFICATTVSIHLDTPHAPEVAQAVWRVMSLIAITR